MIGRLRGHVVEQNLEAVIIEAAGVGYEVFCSANTLADLQSSLEQVTVWIHTSVREDAITLYGFSTRTEKQVFESLLKVNGVGPKMAVKILSSSRLPQLVQMIEAGDAQGLSKIPKVGRKTAEQMVLTLRGKIAFDGASLGAATIGDVRGEIASALINLGYRNVDVERVVAKLGASVDLQEGVREGLRFLSQG